MAFKQRPRRAPSEIYAGKLEAIFVLSDGLLSDSDNLRLDPPSRSSTGTGTLALSSGSAAQSMADEEENLNGNGDEDVEERLQLSAILSAGLLMNRRRIFVLGGGNVGLGPAGTETGDVLVILLRCRYPLILRRKGEGWALVGEAYVDGFMYGEGMAGVDEDIDLLGGFMLGFNK
ncbi:uncharacterized protein RAG0_02176 [Rhynchosporium agropyri]|uniref:Uncharacterized protein n=1 Tax=Rhynchosporium agropyri TaxID=914238 RepID=A0A1E1K0Q5_9HELO|nr:uncharacterized protein RAG0_02176 [Rhynchosporium agropyri]